MGSRLWKAALAAALVFGVAACAPLPKAPDPLIVNTTDQVLDGVCDDVHCSLPDAIAASNARPLNTNYVPNEIRLPAGTFSFSDASPIVITDPVVINGLGRSNTEFDLSASPIAAPYGIFDPQATTTLTGVRVVSSAATPTHVLASCEGHVAKSFSLFNSATQNLAATSASCIAAFVGVDVVGPRTVITPQNVTGTGSRLPFGSEPLAVTNVTFINSVITGPSSGDGTSVEGHLTVHPKPGINIQATFNGTHFDRMGLTLGDPAGGSVFGAAVGSSVNLGAESGPKTIEVIPGSSLRLTHTTVYGAGPAGAVIANGDMVLQGATIVNAGPALVVGPGVNITARRAVLSRTDAGPVCTAPITMVSYNAALGSSCGTPSATDLTINTNAELQLGAPATNASRNPTFSMMPAATSPLVDIIAKEWTGGLNCPFDLTQNQGLSIDQRGYQRPLGAACDIGSVEHAAV